MNNQWKLKEKAPQAFIESLPEFSQVLLQWLFARNVRSREEIDLFLNPRFETGIFDPFLFRDMKRAVERIFDAITRKEMIVIYGDYDADGITAAVIGATVFQELGLKEGSDFSVYLPDRDKEGYGLNSAALNTLAQGGAKLVITADCGITNIAEVDAANALGMDVIITDHHSIPEVLPKAYAVLNPRLPDETYPCKLLCGAGTLFKLMQGVLKEAETRKLMQEGHSRESIVKWLFDIAAIGTVADMVPLLSENRVMVKYGLVVLEQTRRLGLQKLIEKAYVSGSAREKTLTVGSVGFQIAPRINAAGRLEHSSQSYRLLMSEDEGEAEDLAASLNATNVQRQQITGDMFDEGKHQIKAMDPSEKIYCLIHDSWSQGVVGLVAGKLASEYYRPVIVATRISGRITGSGRSIRELDLIAALRELEPRFFEKLGGHPMACGFTLGSDVSFEEFRFALATLVEKKLAGMILTPSLDIESELCLSQVDWSFYEDLQRLEPYGIGNPEPMFLFRNCEVEDAFAIGSGGKHLRLRIKQTDAAGTAYRRNVIGFCFGDRCTELTSGSMVDLVAHVGVNEWNGNRELQLRLVDMKLVERSLSKSVKP